MNNVNQPQPTPKLFSATRLRIAGALLVALVFGFALGALAYKGELHKRVAAKVAALFAHHETGLVYERAERATAFQILEISRLRLGRAFVVDQAGDDLVISSHYGQFSTLHFDAKGDAIRDLGLTADLNLEGLRASGLEEDGGFGISDVRVTDILVTPKAENQYDLYAAHLLYEKDCFRNVVDHAVLEQSADGLHAARDGKWDRVYTTDVCVPLREGTARFYGGHLSGGRMAMLRPGVLLVTVGTFLRNDEMASVYRDTNLGKLMEVPLDGSPPRIYARGLRSPGGLAWAYGKLWESEHGPQGGDELNIMTRGADYGWPYVTYGLEYNPTPTQWHINKDFSGHDGYVKPVFFWAPSIGPSNVLAPDAREFPHWDHHLLLASLRGRAIHAMRLEGERVMSDETIEIGERIRDMVSLKDGRIAFTSDDGDLFFVRNKEHDAGARADRLLGVENLPALLPEEALLHSTDPVRAGAMVFALGCANCHALDGKAGAGPPLNGVIGRRVGSVEGFAYSDALKHGGGSWSRDRLAAYVRDPNAMFPGAAMPGVAMSDDDARNLAAYLATRE